MKIVCITLLGDYVRMGGLYGDRAGATAAPDRTRTHFAERGVDATFFYGIHADRLGIRTIHPYEVDHPGSGFNMGAKPTGCWLSHRALWAALLMMPDEKFLVLEDDARFAPDWRERTDRALAAVAAVQGGWDMLFLGSCCTAGKARQPIGADVYGGVLPLCTHGYVVHRRALVPLMETQDAVKCYAPIDISLTFHSMPKLKVFTVLPRIIDQFETNIPE